MAINEEALVVYKPPQEKEAFLTLTYPDRQRAESILLSAETNEILHPSLAVLGQWKVAVMQLKKKVRS